MDGTVLFRRSVCLHDELINPLLRQAQCILSVCERESANSHPQLPPACAPWQSATQLYAKWTRDARPYLFSAASCETIVLRARIKGDICIWTPLGLSSACVRSLLRPTSERCQRSLITADVRCKLLSVHSES